MRGFRCLGNFPDLDGNIWETILRGAGQGLFMVLSLLLILVVFKIKGKGLIGFASYIGEFNQYFTSQWPGFDRKQNNNILPALQPNSERFQQGSKTAAVFRGVHFRVTSPRPQRLKLNRFAVGNYTVL